MKRIFVLFIFSLFLCALSAQTIYHYKFIGIVNPITGEKKQLMDNYDAASKTYYSPEEHIIITNSYATFCLADGSKYKEDVVSKEEDLGYGVKSITKKTGTWYQLDFDRTENGMVVYKGVYSVYCSTSSPMTGTQVIQNWTRENFLYVSKDFRRINHITKTIDRGEVKNSIAIYELYDSEPIGSIQHDKNSFDPNTLNQIY